MKKKLIRLTESDLHSIIKATVTRMLRESDCQGVMQGGGSNPSAGQYETPFGGDNATSKRSHSFKKGTMATQHATDEGTDVINKTIYNPKA